MGCRSSWRSNPDRIARLAPMNRFARFAARYDGQPWVRYLDVGSIGDWGEGHLHSGSRKAYGYEVRKQHIDLHLKYFLNTRIVVSDDFVYAIQDAQERRRMHGDSGALGIWTIRLKDSAVCREAGPTRSPRARPWLLDEQHYYTLATVEVVGSDSGTPRNH
jgi:hypothetical protein